MNNSSEQAAQPKWKRWLKIGAGIGSAWLALELIAALSLVAWIAI